MTIHRRASRFHIENLEYQFGNLFRRFADVIQKAFPDSLLIPVAGAYIDELYPVRCAELQQSGARICSERTYPCSCDGNKTDAHQYGLCLPSYTPEYNPDEYLNSDLKNNIASKPQARNLDEIQTATEEFMTFLSEKPEHVAAYFEHVKVVGYQDDSPDETDLM